MTHDTPPKRIWAWPNVTQTGVTAFGSGHFRAEPRRPLDDPGSFTGTEYILATESDAMVAAALRGAADLADTTFSGSGTDAAMVIRHAILASIPQPASAALDKLIAEAVNNAMLQCIGIVANLRNKRNPGPLFEVLNRAMSDIEDARFAAIREKNNG